MLDPVFQQDETKKWYFWNEVWADCYGPFDSEAEAREKLHFYCMGLNYEGDPANR